MEIEDPTDNFFSWIFQQIENVFLSTEPETVTFKLFTDEEYTISTNQIYVPNNPAKTLIGLSIDFGLYFYIIYDVRKTVNKIKEGKIESLAEEDVTANMV